MTLREQGFGPPAVVAADGDGVVFGEWRYPATATEAERLAEVTVEGSAVAHGLLFDAATGMSIPLVIPIPVY